jgi:hypothetical protein
MLGPVFLTRSARIVGRPTVSVFEPLAWIDAEYTCLVGPVETFAAQAATTIMATITPSANVLIQTHFGIEAVPAPNHIRVRVVMRSILIDRAA